MMDSNVPNLMTGQPSPSLLIGGITSEQFTKFFPADLIAHPNIYELELKTLFETHPGIRVIWETGQSTDADALKALNDAVINIAVERVRQQSKKA
jgi:hypothetical protein